MPRSALLRPSYSGTIATRVALVVGCVLGGAAPANAWEWPSVGDLFDRDAAAETENPTKRPGGRDWWRTHKKTAEFVPGRGYQVPGFDGFYDQNGVPIGAGVDEQTVRLNVGRQEDAGLLPGLDPKKAVDAVRDAAGYGPDEQAARAALESGIASFREQRYAEAADRFESAAGRWPGTAMAAKALFNQGEAHFFAKKYDDAVDAYTSLLDKHPSTPRLDDTVNRLWAIAQYWEQDHFSREWKAPLDTNPFSGTRPTFDTIGHAVRVYESIRLNDPTGPRADDAIMATAGIHFRRQRYADADYHYTLLREEYPRSEHQFEAHLLGLQAKLLRYQGPEYDGTPLEAALRLEEQTRLVFAGRLTDEETTRLRDVRAKLAAAVDERDLRMATYYQGAEHHGAARYYLAQMLRERPDGPAAKEARGMLAQLDGKPNSPDVPLEWFVGMFPENKRVERIRELDEMSRPAAADDAPPALDPDSGRTLVAETPGDGETATR